MKNFVPLLRNLRTNFVFMFTQGRIIFTIIFLVVFIVAMIIAYRKDMKQIKAWFGNTWQILLAVVTIVFLYYIFARVV